VVIHTRLGRPGGALGHAYGESGTRRSTARGTSEPGASESPARMSATQRAGLALRNIAFTVVVPGAGGVYAPWLILRRHGALPALVAWPAVAVIAAGLALYLSCQWKFAVVGHGTPATWDAPRRLVAVGPYRWVRNPIYIAALLIILGQAWLFLSVDLLLYAGTLAVGFHLLVTGYEEPRLQAQFGEQYTTFRLRVHRWVPRPPRAAEV
jgi:protein-S-isoprenylcysteine O-methyltransferase Ste14